MASLPNAVRRRFRDDPASLAYFAAILRDASGAGEAGRALAVTQLGWSADRRYVPLILAVAQGGRPGLRGDGDYNAAYQATLALAPYVDESRAVRRVVWWAARDSTTPEARRVGALALAAANTPWARRALRRLPLHLLDDYTQRVVGRALLRRPCTHGRVFVEHFGIEGQDYSRCELPPDLR